MCLALYKPAGIAPDWNALENGMNYNPDGAGFAVAVDGQLIVEKGFFKFEHFKKALEPFGEYAAIIHFRISTHGKVNQDNCHPFDLRTFGDGGGCPAAVIHNGMFFEAANDNPSFSDTWHICRDILHPFWLNDHKYFMRPEFITMGDMMVGRSNKLVFLNADGDFAIWGEANGHWKNGVWWSNSSYEDWRCADPRGYSYSAKSKPKQAWTTTKNPDGTTTHHPVIAVPVKETLTDKEIDDMDEEDWEAYLSARSEPVSEGGWAMDDGLSEEDSYAMIIAEIGEENEWMVTELGECGYTLYDLEMLASRKDGAEVLRDELQNIYGVPIPNHETLKRITHV